MSQAIGRHQPARAYPQALRLFEEDTYVPRRDPRALFAVPLIGTAATAVSGWAALLAVHTREHLPAPRSNRISQWPLTTYFANDIVVGV